MLTTAVGFCYSEQVFYCPGLLFIPDFPMSVCYTRVDTLRGSCKWIDHGVVIGHCLRLELRN